MSVHLTRGSDGQFYLTLVARNGEKLAVSEGYRTKWGAKRAAKRNFKGIELEDLT